MVDLLAHVRTLLALGFGDAVRDHAERGGGGGAWDVRVGHSRTRGWFQREGDAGAGGRAPRACVPAKPALMVDPPQSSDDVLANRHPLPTRARRRSARGAECDRRQLVGSTGARRVGRLCTRAATSEICPKRVSAPRGRITIGTGGGPALPRHPPSRRRSRSRVGQNGRRYPDAPGHALPGPQGSRVAPPRRLRQFARRPGQSVNYSGRNIFDRRSVTRRHPWRSDRRP